MVIITDFVEIMFKRLFNEAEQYNKNNKSVILDGWVYGDWTN
jgi:hypothetical protein